MYMYRTLRYLLSSFSGNGCWCILPQGLDGKGIEEGKSICYLSAKQKPNQNQLEFTACSNNGKLHLMGNGCPDAQKNTMNVSQPNKNTERNNTVMSAGISEKTPSKPGTLFSPRHREASLDHLAHVSCMHTV